jgi:rare lipoprotein A
MRRRHLLGGLGAWVATGLAAAEQAEPVHQGESVGQTATPQSTAAAPPLDQGRATWYGGARWHGRRTASGERFDRHALTAAHRSLPFGTWLRVVNLANGREVLVRVNDRGPVSRRFIIDLSEAAARRLDFVARGTAQVRLHIGAPAHTGESGTRPD